MSYCHPKCHHSKNRVVSADNSAKTRDCSSDIAIVQNICSSDITDEALEGLMMQALVQTAERDPWGFALLSAQAVEGNQLACYLLDLLPNPPSRAIQ